jgi:hypothetical protein
MNPAAGVYCVAAVTRVAYLAIFRPSIDGAYLAVADGFVGSRAFDAGLSTSFEPGYPALLAAGRLLFGDQLLAIQMLQILVAAAGAPLLYQLTLRLTAGSSRAATLAALMFAVHPLLVRHAAAATDLALTSTLLVAFSLAFVRIANWRGAALAGLWIGSTVLTRSMTLPVLVIAAGILVAKRLNACALVLTLAAAVLVAPMVARNYMLTGMPWPTRSGVNLYIGNSPYTRSLLPTYDLDLLEAEAYERFVRARPDADEESYDEDAEFDAFLTRAALSHIAANPAGELWQKILNVGYQLSPRIAPFYVSGADTRVVFEDNAARVVDSHPRPSFQIWSHGVSASVLLVGTVAGVFLRRRDLAHDAVLWAVVATFVGVNALYVPATRYTAPMLFVMMFYSAVALSGFTSSRFTSNRLMSRARL